MRKFFIHLHIPKCGGSSVVDFLYRNFGSKLGQTNSILNDYQYDSAQISRIIDHFPNLQCLTGHKISLDLPTERNDLDLTAFTWIRDPVDRFISHYFYHRNHTTIVPEAKSLSLDEYVHWALEEGNQEMYIDGQTRFLANGDLDLIERKVEDGSLLLFPMKKLEQSLYTLAQLFPDTFKDWRLKTRNVSKKDQAISDDLRERLKPYVSSDTRLLELAEKTTLEGPPEGGRFDAVRRPMGPAASQKIAVALRRIAARVERMGE